MATVKYLLQSSSVNSNIYVRFSINRKTVLKRKTGFVINSTDWNSERSQPKMGREDLKRIKSKLDYLALFIQEAYNTDISKGVELNGDWLQYVIDQFNNKTPVVELDVLTNYIEKYKDEAPFKTNSKGGTGLSAGRISNIKLFKNTILRYEKESLNSQKVIIKNIDIQFAEDFKIWLSKQGYSISYIGKNIANLNTMCNDAFKNGIETNKQIKNIKVVSEKRKPEDIVYLSTEEQQKIKETELTSTAYINARKWLLLGCLIGQRGGDLLSLTPENIKEWQGHKIIELVQQKTGKQVAIPVSNKALEYVESDFPYKISLAKFNEYIKKICEKAEINIPTIGLIKEEGKKAKVKTILPKWKTISSHVCRRSFATNYYTKIPTPLLMNITAHSSEKVFLAYIGKTTYDNASQILDYFNKLD
ncbi:transposase [Flavobacterium ammoniigenes]|uniref:Transposase n=1 Tax=Flavobacterium ammoniigenes TaxID=1751095 RepID=A0ABM7V5M2_9FLAO|nr:phage integrase SAM-like domain-containing protein [Flavobacterium ammoniigenes]BDB54868.1 transposase [Flavobacterium ammoniigenes]